MLLLINLGRLLVVGAFRSISGAVPARGTCGAGARLGPGGAGFLVAFSVTVDPALSWSCCRLATDLGGVPKTFKKIIYILKYSLKLYDSGRGLACRTLCTAGCY